MKFSPFEDDPQLSQEANALISNGIDFLDKAMQELQTNQLKFSIVSFWTAVEILIKVPLVHEHWTLVCSGKKIVRKKYLSGDFVSISYDEACARLGDVLEKPLSKETMDAFDIVRKHRNRVVHFFHEAFSEADHHQVMAEQANAWFALNRLMRDEWSELFHNKLMSKFALNELAQLRRNEYYAAAKFRHESVQSRIKSEQAAGRKVTLCNGCHQQAVIIKHPAAGMPLTEEVCLVCSRINVSVEVKCTECGGSFSMEHDGAEPTCPHCTSELDRYDVIDQRRPHSRDDDHITPAGCSDCEKEHSVTRYGEGFLCTECLTYHHDLEICDYCGHWSTDVPEISAAFGCAFCDGHRELRDD